MQDMNEVLMLDMSGNGDYPPALGPPGEAAHFAFTDHGCHLAPADSSDVAWQIAEVLRSSMALPQRGAPDVSRVVIIRKDTPSLAYTVPAH